MPDTYTLKVLTPIHIGSGQKILPLEFVYDIAREEVMVVDMDAFFQANVNILPVLIKKMEERGFNLTGEYFNAAVKNPKYRLHCEKEAMQNLKQKVNSGNTYIQLFVKDAGRNYIPGSSIKGALRSFISKAWLNRNTMLRKNYEQKIVKALSNSQIRREWKSSEADRDIFGNPNTSPFRFLKPGDSQTIFLNNLMLIESRVLNICDGRVKWMISPGNNTTESKRATPIFLEAVEPGTETTGAWKLEVPSNFVIQNGGIKSAGLINKAFELIKETSYRHLTEEREFFETYSFHTIAEKYRMLIDEHKNLKENEIIFSMSWGAGYNFKTVCKLMSDDTQDNIKRFILGQKYKTGLMFPKTRRIVFKGGQPDNVLGWVKLTIN